ncbi:hypothetical protein E4T56_gene15325 [Termitomyces sp. T112]|nr:hypothetical protein E4T56_gene15325 [Termitomyces sp. T112]
MNGAQSWNINHFKIEHGQLLHPPRLPRRQILLFQQPYQALMFLSQLGTRTHAQDNAVEQDLVSQSRTPLPWPFASRHLGL